jgi:hypothetical protein
LIRATLSIYFDRAIDRAMGEVEFVWKLLDEKGPDAAWPFP